MITELFISFILSVMAGVIANRVSKRLDEQNSSNKPEDE